MKLVRDRAKLWWFIVVLVFAGAIATTAIYMIWFQPQRVSSPTAVVQAPTPKPVSLSANTLFLGNVYWGRYINDWSMKSPLKTAYPFSGLSAFNRESYDAWIAGLECPTVAGFTQTSAEEDETLSFNCSPDYLPEAAKWFNIFTLANNHTDNREAAGFEETKQQLDKHGIQYFGHYDPYAKEEACEVIAMPVSVTYDNDEVKKEKLPMAFCGFHGVFKIPPAETIAQIEKYADSMPVIAMPHMGAEYVPEPDQIKTSTYRAMIDAGADIVLGDHPHWVQSTESYKGKLIVYSMGNFMFDQQGSIELTRSAGINVVMSTTDTSSEQLSKWTKLGEDCATFKDTCLEKAQEGNLQEIALQYRYRVVGTNNEGKLAKPATAAEQASILQRLNWVNTMNQLQSPHGSL
ncbi:MAG: CapA family protein [Candidatus Microsaccharimonas sp.]